MYMYKYYVHINIKLIVRLFSNLCASSFIFSSSFLYIVKHCIEKSKMGVITTFIRNLIIINFESIFCIIK